MFHLVAMEEVKAIIINKVNILILHLIAFLVTTNLDLAIPGMVPPTNSKASKVKEINFKIVGNHSIDILLEEGDKIETLILEAQDLLTTPPMKNILIIK